MRRTAMGMALGGAIAALALMATVSPARRYPGLGPVAVAAHFPQSADTTVPGPGDGGVESSTLPPTAESATLTLDVAGATFDRLTQDLVEQVPGIADLTKRSQRIVTCFYASAYHGLLLSDNAEDFDVEGASAASAYLSVCLRLALALSPPPTASAAAISTRCSTARKAIAVTFTRIASGWKAHVRGTSFTPKRRSPLSVGCRRVGRRQVRITVAPRIRGQRLHSVVGSTLGIGFVNPSSSPVRVHTTIAVR